MEPRYCEMRMRMLIKRNLHVDQPRMCMPICFQTRLSRGILNSHLSSHSATPSFHCSQYTYFIWLNSSVRGPFVPSYIRHKLHWTLPFTSKLNDSVKLVGATINCGGAQGRPPEPHVQSYLVATDRNGLDILQSTPGVFKCWPDMASVVLESEIGASRAILDAGYNIDSLMVRYQGLDWRAKALRDADTPCNEGLNPLQPGFNDGLDIDPLEVMFVKVKASMLAAGWPHAAKAALIDEWIAAAEVGGDVAITAAKRNAWLDGGAQAAEADAARRGQACFDWRFYLDANSYDLGHFREADEPAAEAWDQFMRMGIFEGRPHRWSC